MESGKTNIYCIPHNHPSPPIWFTNNSGVVAFNLQSDWWSIGKIFLIDNENLEIYRLDKSNIPDNVVPLGWMSSDD